MNYTKRVFLPVEEWVDKFNSLTDLVTIKRESLNIKNFRDTLKLGCFKLLEDKMIDSSFIVMDEGKLIEYSTRKDNSSPRKIATPAEAMRSFCGVKSAKLQLNAELPFPVNCTVDVTGVRLFNKNFYNKREHCYYYDRNSAWSTVMYDKMPDFTSTDWGMGLVPKGYIGLDADGSLVREGEYCMFYVPLIDTPDDIREWILKIYDKKKNAKTEIERNKAKGYLNYVIGCMQHHQPHWRTYIIDTANKIILNYYNPSTVLYINTDCVVSTVRIPELEEQIGSKLGQWKYKECDFAIRETNGVCSYQIDNNSPVWCGMPESSFSEGYDILLDETPDKSNGVLYFYDDEKDKFVRRV